MLIDFKIDKAGDLVFQEQDNSNNSIKVSFNISKTKAVKVLFDIIECEKTRTSENALSVSFEIDKNTANKSVVIVKDDSAVAQLIELKLKTVLGELPLRKDFGSRVSELKYKTINNMNLRLLENYILEAIKDFTIGAKVIATPYINYDNGYSQTVNVEIYSDNKKILNYILER